MPGPILKRIEFSTGRMTGKSGKNYFIQSDLSAERFTYFTAYQPMITKGATYTEWAAANNRIYALLTSGNNLLGNIHEAATIAYNQNATFKKFEEERYHAIMYFCMLFINEENEDIGGWDLRTARLKIEDLSHYSMADFFLFAEKALSDWEANYRKTHGRSPLEDAWPEIAGKSVTQTLTQPIGSI